MKYRVTTNMTISVSTVVEADSPEEAKAKAMDHDVQSLPHDASDPEKVWCHSGQLDGDLDNNSLTVEEEP